MSVVIDIIVGIFESLTSDVLSLIGWWSIVTLVAAVVGIAHDSWPVLIAGVLVAIVLILQALYAATHEPKVHQKKSPVRKSAKNTAKIVAPEKSEKILSSHNSQRIGAMQDSEHCAGSGEKDEIVNIPSGALFRNFAFRLLAKIGSYRRTVGIIGLCLAALSFIFVVALDTTSYGAALVAMALQLFLAVAIACATLTTVYFQQFATRV